MKSFLKTTLKTTVKSIVKSDVFINVMARLAWLYIKFVQMSSRWQIIHENRVLPFVNEKKPLIVVFWHNRLFLNALGWPYKTPFYMLISKHSDGKLISKVMENFGIDTIEGSTNKGGAKALKTMVKTIKSGAPVGITPDGPRGPRFHISDGVIALAKLTGAPIMPGISSVKRRKILGSWDRFIFALPFSKACFVWGKPIYLEFRTSKDDKTSDADPKERCDPYAAHKKRIHEALIQTCDEADLYCDHSPFLETDDHLKKTEREQQKKQQQDQQKEQQKKQLI